MPDPPREPSVQLDRRMFVAATAGVGAQMAGLKAWSAEKQAALRTRQAMGTRVGEVTDRSAIVWMRLTAARTRKENGPVVRGFLNSSTKPAPLPGPVAQLEGACPGAAGRVRVRYGTRPDLADARATPWVTVSADTDYVHQFALDDLQPETVYHYAADTAGPEGDSEHAPLHGRFETAPPADASRKLSFCVLTCLMYAHLDDPRGYHIFPAIEQLQPKFVTFTGDNVYYDNEEPRAVTAELARYHWQRMYSLPRHIELLRNVASYWEKDDHDTLRNDCWPGMKPQGKLTFAEGQAIFRQQVPLGPQIYRTFRWGRDLQIWLTDGRDFRSANYEPDGPSKSIWGAEQKRWLQESLLASDATWKVLISPTPLVGPDRAAKNDNHANAGFTYESRVFRRWANEKLSGNLFLICGDRHWQYHSVDPETGLHEFACGAGSDEHAGGSPGPDANFHRFHRVGGGFVSVSIDGPKITFRHHDVHGQPVHQWQTQA